MPQAPNTSVTTPANWTVWRQDDNGNRFAIRQHLPEAEAQSLVRHYEGLGHRQVYWAEREEAKA